MKKLYRKSLFIFRRDLRLADNTGLILALQQSDKVIPTFIVDPAQVGFSNSYRSMNAVQFMFESLFDVDAQLKKKGSKLFCFYGESEEIVKKVIKQENIDAVFCNRDYTPFSIKRDSAIEKICNNAECAFVTTHDALLHTPEAMLKKDLTPYSIFTAFYKNARKIDVNDVQKTTLKNFYRSAIEGSHSLAMLYKQIVPEKNALIHCHGGTDEALKKIHSLKQFSTYSHDHNFPAKSTTNLSAHLKFGTVSIRHVYHAIGKQLGNSHPLVRQLYWRDFFTYIAYYSPSVFGHAYHKKFDQLSWKNDVAHFNAWCSGTTGFPIVDAGMRQLITTGFMHNRVRLIVASFLTKDLHIDWRWGEKFFAQHLVDYDPAVNNGNWQWVASTGCDAQPYFRIFNPWLQQKKFDPLCIYIKTWVNELAHVQPAIIHAWYKHHNYHLHYPKPIVDHEVESKLAKQLYKKCS